MQKLERKVLFAQIKVELAEEIFANATNDWLNNLLFMKIHGTKIFIPTKVLYRMRNRVSEKTDSPEWSIEWPKILMTQDYLKSVSVDHDGHCWPWFRPISAIFQYRSLSTKLSYRPRRKPRDPCHSSIKRFQRSKKCRGFASDDARPPLTYNYRHPMIQT